MPAFLVLAISEMGSNVTGAATAPVAGSDDMTSSKMRRSCGRANGATCRKAEGEML